MIYRHLGSAGIKVSVISLGSWVTYGSQVDIDTAAQMIKYAYDHGVNYFDNAESYAGGQSEVIMGQAFRRLGLRRGSYLVSTKLFWGIHEGPNEKNTLNRKYLLEAIEGSLGQSTVLGNKRMVCGADSRSMGNRGQAQPSKTADGATPIQHAGPHQSRKRVCTTLSGHRSWAYYFQPSCFWPFVR